MLSDVHFLDLFIANVYSSFNGKLSEQCRGFSSNSKQTLHHSWLSTGLHTEFSKISLRLFYSVGYSSLGGYRENYFVFQCSVFISLWFVQRLAIIFDIVSFCKAALSTREWQSTSHAAADSWHELLQSGKIPWSRQDGSFLDSSHYLNSERYVTSLKARR